MSRSEHLVKVLGAFLALLLSCLFVSRYNWASSLAVDAHGRPWPAVTEYLVRAAPYAYVIPVAVLLSGVLLLRHSQRSATALQILIALGYLAAFFWSMAAIYVWQVAHIETVSNPGHL
jgi:hypothetical protein